MNPNYTHTTTLFPAQAGVIPSKPALDREIKTVPRASGGDPPPPTYTVTVTKLFPAQAGVILKHMTHTTYTHTVPRASGGDPAPQDAGRWKRFCSPRKRG